VNNPYEADLVVVGLGPAGACAAAAAAAAGASVIAIDRKHTVGLPLQCAEFVPGPLYAEIDNLSSATRQTISSMRTMIGAKNHYESPDFRGAMIDRIDFDQMLVTEARRAGARILLNAKLAAIEDAGLRLVDGRLLKARAVIGGDGPRSCVGATIGEVNREIVETRQITVALLAPSRATDIFLSADYRGGYAWLFPKGDYAHLGVGVDPSERTRLKFLLNDLHLKLVQERRVGRKIFNLTGGAIPVGGMLRPWGHSKGRPVLLAGDAAGLSNPITGAGIAAAVLSGRMAGKAAIDVLSGNLNGLTIYAEDLRDLFGVALGRAVRRRKELLSAAFLDADTMRRGWIAFPEYWDSFTKVTADELL
jgi:geranylgeranyl reductase family protein